MVRANNKNLLSVRVSLVSAGYWVVAVAGELRRPQGACGTATFGGRQKMDFARSV